MLRHETVELRILRHIGTSRVVSVAHLTQAVGPNIEHKYVVERLKYLHENGWIKLHKWFDTVGWIKYSDAASPYVLGENDFFYVNSFRVLITPEGRVYFEQLEEREKAEKKLQIEDPIVFISCGQCTREEIGLGLGLEALVNELTECKGYFAQKQSSLEAVSQNILRALDRAVGFVAVLHPRGQVHPPKTQNTSEGMHVRGSVWVEQEVAIAAFLTQAQHRDIPALVYTHETIKREGLREQLKLEPLTFREEQQVLDDFRERLTQGKFKPGKVVQRVA